MFTVAAIALTLSACAHVPLRQFDCVAILGLRLGQTRQEVKALLGEPRVEAGTSFWWDDKIPVVDYAMWFTDFDTHHWVPSSRDYFWVEFFRDHLVQATAYRTDSPFIAPFSDRSGLTLGSLSYGQPTISRNEPPILAQARVGTHFDAIFQCAPDPRLDQARVAFEAQAQRP